MGEISEHKSIKRYIIVPRCCSNMIVVYMILCEWLWFQWICSSMISLAWSSCRIQRWLHWLRSFWTSHSHVMMMKSVRTLVCNGGRSSVYIVLMVGMLISISYLADSMSSSPPFKQLLLLYYRCSFFNPLSQFITFFFISKQFICNFPYHYCFDWSNVGQLD